MIRRLPSIVATSCMFLGLLITQKAANAQTMTATTTTTTTTPQSTTTTATSTTLPSGVELEIGMGSRIGGPEISNYQTANGALSLTNLGRATPQLMAGLGFAFCESQPTPTTTAAISNSETHGFNLCSNRVASRLGVFVSAQFGAGSNQAISGYSIGMTIGMGKYLRGLVGFSETPVNQISPGFETAASQYVARNAALFPGINSANLAANSYGAFDGIQFTNTAPAAGSPATSTIYYPGSITETHYRGGILIGVSFPISIYNIFKGNNSGGN